MSNWTRRSMLRWGGSAAAVALAAPVAGLSSPAAHFRGLISLQLIGGNDFQNLLVPLEEGAYANYRRARGVLALERGQLLAVRDGDAEYGLHESAAPLLDLFAAGRAKLIGGIAASELSHTDRLLHYLPDGHFLPAWAGAAATSVARGKGVAFAVGGDLPGVKDGVWNEAEWPELPRAAVAEGLTASLYSAVRGLAAAAGAGADWAVAQVSMGGFDLHAAQREREALLFARLSVAIAAADECVRLAGLDGLITMATDSEFGRTVAPNRQGGTDHAITGVQLAVGGAVVGPLVQGAAAADSLARGEYHQAIAGWLRRSGPASRVPAGRTAAPVFLT